MTDQVETETGYETPELINAEISFEHISEMYRFLQVATSRGAFQLEEFPVITAITGPVKTFIEAHEANKKILEEAKARSLGLASETVEAPVEPVLEEIVEAPKSKAKKAKKAA